MTIAGRARLRFPATSVTVLDFRQHTPPPPVPAGRDPDHFAIVLLLEFQRPAGPLAGEFHDWRTIGNDGGAVHQHVLDAG